MRTSDLSCRRLLVAKVAKTFGNATCSLSRRSLRIRAVAKLAKTFGNATCRNSWRVSLRVNPDSLLPGTAAVREFLARDVGCAALARQRV
jgi:hypothetical protein